MDVPSTEGLGQGLSALFGATGIGAAFIAWMAHRTAALAGRRGDPTPSAAATAAIAVGCGLADRASFDQMTQAVTLQTTVLQELVVLLRDRETREQKEHERDAIWQEAMAHFRREHGMPMVARDPEEQEALRRPRRGGEPPVWR